MEETTRELWKVECEPACGVLTRSHDRDELVTAATHHTKQIHDKDLPQAEIENLIKPV